MFIFFFKQKTAYEFRISDWSSDVCSSDLRKPEDVDAALRPKTLDEFVGQKGARDNLRVFIEAARTRGEALDHVLFFGPRGLGKTTLAQIDARELRDGIRATACPVIAQSGALAALLNTLDEGDARVVEGIHPPT